MRLTEKFLPLIAIHVSCGDWKEMGFWTANIERRGRLIRGISAVAMLLAAFLLHREGVARWPWLLGVAGLFTAYEALRGWCVLRACKIKTRF